jgi:hypothetical protein
MIKYKSIPVDAKATCLKIGRKILEAENMPTIKNV